MTKTVNRKSLISWIVTLALPIIILLIPTTEAFTSDIRTFFAITLMGIAMFCFDEMDNAIAGILMMLLYIMTGIAPSGTWCSPRGPMIFPGTSWHPCFW